ncbi:hypothetical protein BGZ65_012660 [Modicella reniformis]|uniref:Uncharacterized protein n=1 Tax=Modicella reniformis TaxID=1440133 RepID=A0A9P6J3K7_9FUNG|nr:hypothetical protein BGZ65_012660 [Modicella reniformis]
MYRQEDMDGWNGWTFLVNHHQTSLQHLTVDTWIMMAKHFCIAVAGCSQLKTLKLTGRLIDPLIAPALWSACRAAKMINTLHLEHTALPKWNQEFEEGTATHIRRLIIVEPQKSCDGLDLLQHCPQLQYLHWRDSESVLFPLRKVAESLLRGQWPHLEELDLTLYDSEDQDLAMMIEGITRLVTLHMEFSAFGPKSLQAMSKHFSTIRTLNVAVCMYVSSSMIQTILSSMPALESLKTDRIHYLDIVNGTPWVSLHLQQLIINVDMGTRQKDSDNNFAAHQRIVFERLSTLVRLRVLDLTRTSPTKSARVLDLRLSAGLGALSTLRELESFSFKSHTQQMSMDDIRWIITSWPQLRKISGRFAADPDHYYEIKHLLNSHKILVFD